VTRRGGREVEGNKGRRYTRAPYERRDGGGRNGMFVPEYRWDHLAFFFPRDSSRHLPLGVRIDRPSTRREWKHPGRRNRERARIRRRRRARLCGLMG